MTAKKRLFVAFGAISLFTISCNPSTAVSSASPGPFRTIILRNVQGLFGGQDLWLYADGRLVTQIVKPSESGMVARRYQMHLTAAELDSLQKLLDEHHFADIKTAERNGVPDEARPVITVEFKTGVSRTVEKWANDENVDFDAVYKGLLDLVKRASAGTPVHVGPHDWKWSPDDAPASTRTAAATVRNDAEYAAHVESLKKELPGGFTILVQKPFVVAGDGTPAEVRAAAEGTVKWAVDHLKKDYFAKDPVDPIDVYLFKDKESYDKYTKEILHDTPTTPFGYYSPTHKALIMNIGTGGGTLVHEIVHPFMAANFAACPSWFNEGLASLYEQSAEREGHIVGLTNWRLAGLQEAVKGGKCPAFKDLCATDSAAFYGDGRAVNYAAARYLCYYLQEKGVLREYYKEFVKNAEKDPTGYETLKGVLAGLGDKDTAAFQKKWEAWVLTLRFP